LNSRKHWRVLLAVLAVFALIVAACGGDDDDSSSSTSAGGSSTTAGSNVDFSSLKGTLNGSGATFPQAFYETAIAGLAEEAPNLTVNYGGGGSGKGKQDLADGVVDWAGTDSLVKPEDMAKYDSGGGIFYFPTVAAPITVSFNLSGVEKLQLDADTLAGIFSRKITKWNDSAIAATNDGVDLPSTDIVVAHRADASGTTNNFTKYLMTAAPTAWTLGNGDTVNWPADTQAGNGNPGVAQIVSQTNGAIGYVDLADATAAKLDTAKIKNSSGSFIAPTLDGAQAAVETAQVNPDLTYNPLNASGPKAYPITSPTYIIVYKTTKNSAQTANIQGWLNYVLGPAQDMAKDAGFASLPSSLKDQAVAQIEKIK
jgi:phosphate transport system substrate-binding protein